MSINASVHLYFELKSIGANDITTNRIQLFQKTLSKEKQKAHKPRLQGDTGIFETSLQCRHHIAKIFPVALDMDERSVRV